MPRNLPQFTRSAPPGAAKEYAVAAGLLALIVGGAAGYFVGVAITLGGWSSCVAIGLAVAVGLIAVIDDFRRWFYHSRLMSIQADQCVAGTVAGQPRGACDGDHKVDTLLAPFRHAEVERVLMPRAAQRLIQAGALPTPPTGIDLTNREHLLKYVEGNLSTDERTRLYVELVHHQMLNQPGRGYLGRYYRREQAAMGQAAYKQSPCDAPDDTACPKPNPLFRFDGDGTGGTDLASRFICQGLLGVPNDEQSEHRLIPYIHCEMEGYRLAYALTNIEVALVGAASAYIGVCLGLGALLSGASVLLQQIAAVLAAVLGFWLVWHLTTLFYDPTAGDVLQLPLDQADPTAAAPPTPMAQGDALLLFGDWIMDEEHNQYFELHPVKAWYRLGSAPDALAPLIGDPNRKEATFDISQLSEETFDQLRAMVTDAETTDPPPLQRATTSQALSMAGGLL